METNNRPRFCSQCGNRLPENAVFCPDCGAKIGPTVQLVEPAPPREARATSEAQMESSPTVDSEDKTASTSNNNNLCSESSHDDTLKKRPSCFRSIVMAVLVLAGLYGLFWGISYLAVFSSGWASEDPPVTISTRPGVLSDRVVIIRNLSGVKGLYATIRFENEKWHLGKKAIVIPANGEVSLGALELDGYRPTDGDCGVLKIDGYRKNIAFEIWEGGGEYNYEIKGKTFEEWRESCSSDLMFSQYTLLAILLAILLICGVVLIVRRIKGNRNGKK